MNIPWDKIWSFIGKAFSENGTPSSSRILSGILSIWTMLIIGFTIRHCFYQPTDKLAIWLPNLPMIIGALAVLTTMPYGVGKAGQALMSLKTGQLPVVSPDPAQQTTVVVDDNAKG
jgi:hypothetical protein